MPPVAASLFVVLVVAKLLVVGRHGPWILWQDALVAIVFGLVETFAFSGRRVVVYAVYAILAIWIAINVPVALVLKSWLTTPMLMAAGGPLADSIRYYVTMSNVVAIGVVLVAGVVAPLLLGRRRVPMWAGGLILGVALSTGIIEARDVRGLDRNPLTALAPRIEWDRAAGNRERNRFTSRSRYRVAAGNRPDVPAPEGIERLHGSAQGLNIVMVILESTAAEYLGLYGADVDPMPNLTQLAGASVVFDAAYAVYPESVKGLYATLCSKMPRVGEPVTASLRDPCAPLPVTLGAAGYRTGLFHAGRFGYLGMDALVARSGFDVAEDAGAIGGVVRSSFGVDEASTVAHTLAWIDEAGEHRADADARPFFALYMPAAGHHPYASAVPGPFAGDTEFDRYRNALHETDRALGTLIDGLRARDLFDRTVFVVFGDHGEAFGQHGGNAGHTLAIWDENVRVPLVVRVPAAAGIRSTAVAPMRIANPASVLDVAPTILELTGQPVPDGIDGVSLIEPGARMAPFFADYSSPWFGIRDGCWKLQMEQRSGISQVFNVCDDPSLARPLDVRRGDVPGPKLRERLERFFEQ